jgi:hypothetical protein
MIAASSAGTIVAGIVALLIGVAVLVGLVYLVFRLVTWPFRRRRSARPAGAGADYEAMIRQQRRQPPAMTSRPLPFPSHSGDWPSDPETMAESRVVLPPPPYRLREPEAEPLAPSIAAPEFMPPPLPPSSWERLRQKTTLTPAWVVMPLSWLGLWFIVSKPLFGAGWLGYGVGLVVALGLGVRAKRNYHTKILWRAPRSVLVWQRWGKQDDSLPLPVAVQAAAQAVAGTAAPESETPDAQRARAT